MEKHRVTSDNARQIWDWLQTRGGLAIWNCADLARAGQTFTCPVNDEHGTPKGKPAWYAGNIVPHVIGG